MHNLLGDTNVLHVRMDEKGVVHFVNEIAGDSVKEVLTYVEYDTDNIVERIRNTSRRAMDAGTISPKQRDAILEAYEIGMQGYTYFEK